MKLRLVISTWCCVAITLVATRVYAPNRNIDDTCSDYQLPSNFSITITNEIVNGTRKFKGCLKNAGTEMPSMYGNAELQFAPIPNSPLCFNLIKSSPFAAKETFHFSIRLHDNNENSCFGKYELTIENPPIPAEPCSDGGKRDALGVCPKKASTEDDDDPTDCDEGYFYDGDFEKCLKDEDDGDDDDADDSEDVTCLPAEILFNGACYANMVKKPITAPAFFPPAVPPTTNQTADAGGGGGCSLMVRP